MITTSEFVRETMENGDYISKLNSKLKYLMNKIEKVFTVRLIHYSHQQKESVLNILLKIT